MIKLGFITFSQDVAEDVARCYATLPELPAQVTLKDTFVYNEDGEAVRAFSIFEYDPLDEDLASDYLSRRYAVFSSIPGLTYTVENWLSVSDALDVLGSGNFSSGFMSSDPDF